MEQNKPLTLFDQIKNLSTAVANWTVKDSFRIVSPEVLEERKKLCFGCEHWDASAFGGVGRCKVCGCSLAKLYMPGSVCPLPEPKWKPIVFTGNVNQKTDPVSSGSVSQ